MVVEESPQVDLKRLALLVGLLAASVALWNTPVVLPFKLLAVMGHETGHAVAALLAGGRVQQISLAPNESGECLSLLPEGFFAKVLVYSAGYVGSAVISVVLLVMTFRYRFRRVMLALACAWLAVVGLWLGRDLFTLAFCGVMALAFGAGARWLPDGVVGGLNLFIAAFTALYATLDLKDDLWNGAVRAQSDAQLLANVTPIPAVLWALAWTLTALAILGFGAWVSVVPRKVRGRARVATA